MTFGYVWIWSSIAFFWLKFQCIVVMLEIIKFTTFPLAPLFMQFAHRKCVQRWCNEKGDITCEICHQVIPPHCHLLEVLLSSSLFGKAYVYMIATCWIYNILKIAHFHGDMAVSNLFSFRKWPWWWFSLSWWMWIVSIDCLIMGNYIWCGIGTKWDNSFFNPENLVFSSV